MLGAASQKFVPIKTIQDGVIELQNGEYRRVLMTNSLNVALKSEDEQTAIISQFQNFFNSLDFPIQIFVKSRRTDIAPYLQMLTERQKQVKEELIKLQISEYIEYIRSFNEETNIMTKEFFVVVPYVAAIISSASNPLSLLSFGSKKEDVSVQNEKNWQEIQQQLEERVDVVISGLSRCGLRIKALDTEETIELYYEIFNPGIEGKSVV
jgi:hypothetical protein